MQASLEGHTAGHDATSLQKMRLPECTLNYIHCAPCVCSSASLGEASAVEAEPGPECLRARAARGYKATTLIARV